MEVFTIKRLFTKDKMVKKTIFVAVVTLFIYDMFDFMTNENLLIFSAISVVLFVISAVLVFYFAEYELKYKSRISTLLLFNLALSGYFYLVSIKLQMINFIDMVIMLIFISMYVISSYNLFSKDIDAKRSLLMFISSMFVILTLLTSVIYTIVYSMQLESETITYYILETPKLNLSNGTNVTYVNEILSYWYYVVVLGVVGFPTAVVMKFIRYRKKA